MILCPCACFQSPDSWIELGYYIITLYMFHCSNTHETSPNFQRPLSFCIFYLGFYSTRWSDRETWTCQNLKKGALNMSESENVRTWPCKNWKMSESFKTGKRQNLKTSESFKTGKCQNLKRSEFFKTGKCQNSSKPENVRIWKCQNSSKPENVRIWKCQNLSKLENVRNL